MPKHSLEEKIEFLFLGQIKSSQASKTSLIIVFLIDPYLHLIDPYLHIIDPYLQH
jgi:hypothetical protein